MKRTKRYYDIYDVSIFDLLRSGGQFPSGSDINEELLAEEYKRGYREGENQLNVKLDEVISKAKAQGELYDPHTVKKFGHYVGQRAYTEAKKEADTVKRIKENDIIDDFIDYNNDLEIDTNLNKIDLELDKKIAELNAYTIASIPTIRMNDQKEQKPLLQSSIEEEIDELLEKEEIINENFNYREQTKELRSQIKKEREDIKELGEILNKIKRNREVITKNPAIDAILNNLHERRQRLKNNESKLKEIRNNVKGMIDKHLKESKTPLDMMQEGVPLGKGRYHAPFAYARKINPIVYSPENLYKKIIERKDELYKEYEQIKRNYLYE